MPLKKISNFQIYRQLFENVAGNPICPFNGLLFDPDLHSVRFDCHHFVGFLLAQQASHASSCFSRCDHRVDHDNAHVLHQRCLAKNLLRQVHRHFPWHLFRHGLCFSTRQVFSFLFISFYFKRMRQSIHQMKREKKLIFCELT